MISAILLAAGQSKRFGNNNKLISKYKNKNLIQLSLTNIINSNIDNVIVVLGHDQTLIKKKIKKNRKIKLVINKNFRSGMASSIKAGLKKINIKTKGFFVCLGDMPKVNKNIYNKIIKSFNKHNQIIVPYFNNKRGNPVIFPIKYKKKFFKLKGDNGAKKLIKNNCQKIIFKNNAVVFDIDYKKDLK